MNEARAEKLLSWRIQVLWVWLLASMVLSRHLDPDPVAAYLALAGLLFAAARWSGTVRRESAVALVLLDAPLIFTIQRQQAWPSLLGAAVVSGVLLALVLLAGVLALRKALAVGLVIELVVMQTSLLQRAGSDGAVLWTALGAVLVALVAVSLRRRAEAGVP